MHLCSFLLLAAVAGATDPRAAEIALLVTEPDAAAIVEPLRAAIASQRPLVRATAARVVNVREVQPAVAAVEEQLDRETDAAAAREEIRAVAALGSGADVDKAIAVARKWPSSIDADLALAVASRGGVEALALYPKLRSLRQIDRRQFFRTALWPNPALVSLAASRVVAEGDPAGLHALLEEVRNSRVAIDPPVLLTALTAANEQIRSESAWHLARVYAADPAQMPPAVRDALAAPTQASTDGQDFAREILARMAGREAKNDPRWTQWLQSTDADAVFGSDADVSLYEWFTDEEFAARKQHCGLLPFECVMPATRKAVSARAVPPRPVAPPDFTLPGVLPPGLTSEMLTCSDGWLGVGTVAVSSTARVVRADVRSTMPGRCGRVLEAILRLSLPSPAAMTSPHQSSNVLLVRAPRQPLCLDEPPPSDAIIGTVLRVGGRVVAPKVVRRVEPRFPESARRAMGSNAIPEVMIVLECVITREGCIRDIRVVGQTPYGDVNGAAVLAVSQWTFKPGTLDGQPVDVIFNLTVSFKVR